MAKWDIWGDIRTNLVGYVVYAILGGSVIATLIAWLRALAGSPVSAATAAVIFCLCAIGLGIFSWLRSRQNGQPTGVRTQMIIYLPLLAGVALCVWAYIVGVRVSQTGDDVRHLRAQMVRYVLPRQLAPEQIESIGEYLLQHGASHAVAIRVIPNDDEADSYRADIQRAFLRGKWTVPSIDPDADIRDGVSISVQEPPVEGTTPIRDMLQEAFKRGGIQGLTVGGSTASPVLITVSVGRRGRSVLSVQPQNYSPRGPARPITDDDFENH